MPVYSVTSAESGKRGLNLPLVCERMEEVSSAAEAESVELLPYLEAHAEAVKLLSGFGRLWSWLGGEADKAQRSLRAMLGDWERGKEEKATAKALLAKEKESGGLEEKESPARALIRLHRLCWFLSRALTDVGRLGEAGQAKEVGTVLRMAYHDTLAPHHSFWQQQAARLALARPDPVASILQRLGTDSEGLQQAGLALNRVSHLLDVVVAHANCLNLK